MSGAATGGMLRIGDVGSSVTGGILRIGDVGSSVTGGILRIGDVGSSDRRDTSYWRCREQRQEGYFVSEMSGAV